MSEVVGEAVVELKTDDKSVKPAAQKAGQDAGKAAGGGFKNAFKGAFTGVLAVAGVSAGIKQVSDFFVSSINGASDLNETISKTQQIFGPASKGILNFASQGAKALGQTKQQALDAASTFGVFGKAAGLEGGKLTGFSTKLTSLATDLASFHNTSPEEAIQALGAALRGESEPIRRYGVLLDDMSLRQEAVRQGLVKTTKTALTPQQKTLASYALIIKKTKDAQGDFQRTSGGLANQQRILASSVTDLKTKVGGALLPAVLAVVRAVNSLVQGTSPVSPMLAAVGSVIANVLWPAVQTLIGGLGDMIGFIQENATWFKILGVAVAILVAPLAALAVVMGVLAAATWVSNAAIAAYNTVVGIARLVTLGWQVATWALNAAWLASPIGVIVVALVAMVAVIVLLWKHSETFRRVVKAVWAGVKAAVLAVVNWFKGPFASFFTKTLPTFFAAAWKKVQQVVRVALKVLLVLIGGWPLLIYAILRRFGPQIVAIFRNAWAAARAAVANGISGIRNLIAGIPGMVTALAGRALAAGKHVGSSIIGGIISGLRAAGGFVGDLASSIKSAINSALHLPVSIKGPGPLPDFNIPAFAGGTASAPGGLAWVGEHGPELVHLPAGSRVKTAGESKVQAAGLPGRVILRVGARDFVAYVEELADRRIDAADVLGWQGA